MDQKRLILALILSTVILFGWQYLLRRYYPEQPRSDDVPQQTQSNMPAASPQNDVASGAEQRQSEIIASSPETVPQQTLVVTTPLYDVRFDNRGAVATSWVIKKNKDTERPLYSVAGDKRNPQPLELISREGLRREPREAPLLLVTGDSSVDAVLATKNYRVSESGDTGDEVRIALVPGQSKQVEFTLRDESSGLEVIKSLTFNADSYQVDVQVKLARSGQAIPVVKLVVGPSIGDQGVPYYDSLYSVAPEGIAAVGEEAKRYYATSINEDKGSPDRQAIGGVIDWAGVGDTYFAMVVVPFKRTEGLEYRTTKYEQAAAKEARYLITGLVPITADGSLNRLYVGPKDHYLLTAASAEVSRVVGRPIDLEGLIDYGFLATISRPLAAPILWSIKHLHTLTGSYGIAIILFTIIIYSLFFPLKWRSSKSMKKAQKLAPRMKELQENIKGLKPNDPRLKELQVEQLRLMKEGNPLGGCLPLLIQMPFFFALYRAITISIDFRQASFLWLPDLSAADPYHLLPVLMAGSMLVLQLVTPAPTADPLQRKMMAFFLPVFMLYMLWSAPAGLLVYWLVGNIVLYAQQLLINRLIKSDDDPAEPSEKKKAEASSTRKPNRSAGSSGIEVKTA